MAYHPKRSQNHQKLRQSKIFQLEKYATQWIGKLGYKDEGKATKGSKLSNSGVKTQLLYHEINEMHATCLHPQDRLKERIILFTH